MIRRIGVFCLLILCVYTSISEAWSSGLTERKKYHQETDEYTHAYAVNCRFETPEKGMTFSIEIRYDTKDKKTIKKSSVYIVTQRKGFVKPYTPEKAVLGIDGGVWQIIKGDVDIGWDENSNKILRMMLSDYELDSLKRLFEKDKGIIGLTIYATNGKVYRYTFDKEQITEIKEVLSK